MEIKKFHLTNIGRFAEIEVLLAPTQLRMSNVTVFVGNNGAGKTSLLKSLATSLSWLVARLRTEKGSGNAIPEEVIRNGSVSAAIDIEVVDTQGRAANPDADAADSVFGWSIAKTRKGRKSEKTSVLADASRLADFYRSGLSRNDKTSVPLIAFYPVERVVLDIPLKIKDKHTFLQLDGYDNSLNQGVDFRRFFEWFREREDTENESGISQDVFEKMAEMFDDQHEIWQKLSDLKASSRDRQLTAVRTAISSFMQGFSNLRVRRKPRLHMSIDKNGETLNVAQLSQGEKSLMALVGDIARRLAMMNLYLHEIEAEIYYGDSLAEGPHTSRRYDCVLTNPPFGSKGGGDVPVRGDFTVQTSNKQLNFLQHVMNILKPGGRAAIVLPDNVLFEDHAGRDVRRLLMTDCDLHTILRLPIGTFTPYSPGVKANILFFRKGLPTEEVWIYDLRTNVEKVTKRHPLNTDYFTDFEACYRAKPRRETERLRRFTRDDITRRDDNLDIFWLKDESLQDADDLPEPEDLVSEAVTQLETALDALRDLALQLQENGK
jgi:predicted ATP-binding protein involved in virulence